MKPLIFRREAEQDLRSIFSYLAKQDVSDTSADRVKADIYETLSRLSMWPESGHVVSGEPGLRTTTPKYRYTITYYVTLTNIEIVGIFKYQNR